MRRPNVYKYLWTCACLGGAVVSHAYSQHGWLIDCCRDIYFLEHRYVPLPLVTHALPFSQSLSGCSTIIFTVLHGMQTRPSDENSVRPSVCLSVCQTRGIGLWLERSVKVLTVTIYERTFSLVFWEEKWLVRGDPFYLKCWVNRPRWSEIADFEPLFAHAPQPYVTRSEKSSINTNRKFTTRFPMSL